MKCVSSFYIDQKFEHDRMIKSLLHFHPEVNLEIVNREEALKLVSQYYIYPKIELPLFNKYSTVTHIDADVIIVDKLDELFDDSTDARGCRNNSDNNRSAFTAGLTPIDGISWDKFINVGVHSVSSPEFMYDWDKLTSERGAEYVFGENDTYNVVFYSGKYNTKLLDPVESKIYYGTSFIEGTVTYWDLWKKIVVKNNHLELNDKRIKLLHIAGGGVKKPSLDQLVTREVEDFIMSITN
jgi:hypothetical protein